MSRTRYESYMISTLLPSLVKMLSRKKGVESFSLVIIDEFSSQDGLDILRLTSEKIALSTGNINLNKIRTF